MTHDTTGLKDAIKHRRTIYQLTKKSPISDEKIKELLTLAIQDVPSSFNSQTTRIVALFKDEHDKFWDLVAGKLKPIVEGQGGDWSKSEARLKMFKDAYATILFYEDKAVVKGLQEKMAVYADKFPQWSEHTSAMHQYMLWTALETEGLGCNLQHYNPIVDKEAAETWKVPAEWELIAQLVIGQPAEGAREGLAKKEMKPVEERLHIHGA
ncbi:Nitroreductase-like protein [Neohortaea acidophila]|uniref:Nitroreductase-like protein n=1 Tax=Neohortaea acidophila TaxID=245834 RepID=A0A6A6PSU3_9PEZI|nr:Nitroreductase-like protein [Neohortaea acidophila]KAF2482754.1 Nitroreductase-like protein [Neohortaea acidophila]